MISHTNILESLRLVLSSVTMLQSKPIISYVVLFGFVSSYYLNTSLRERIPMYLQEICPGSGVCLNDIFDPDNDLPSCCGACSCSVNCEVDGNCCFQDQNNDAIADTQLSTRSYSECLYPIANHKYKVFRYDVYQPYYMISSKEKDTISHGMDNNTDTSCGEVKVAPWGSMYPVYSKTTGKIYKNIVCADAHNITDGELWRAYVLCQKVIDIAFNTRLNSGSISDHCYVVFNYRGGMSVLKSETCFHFEDYEASCLQESFKIPASLSLSREEIVASCESGLVSPYKDVFANVFCFMCRRLNVVELREQDICIEESEFDFVKRSGGISFTIIFDVNEFSETFNDIIQTDHVGNGRVVCPKTSANQTRGGCRAISCPLGQILGQEEGCYYPGNKWFTERFHIIINLSSERTINISTLYDSIQNLKSPWPNSWTLQQVLYKVSAVPMQTRHILVIQYIQFHSPFNPQSIISRMYSYISTPWLLKTNNETIKLQTEISRSRHSKWYDVIYMNRWYANKKINLITKLYLCDRVILLPSEYSIGMNAGFKTLFNWITNKTLFDLEFMIDDNGNGVVCLEDSGFYRVASNNSIKISPHYIIVQCLAIIYMTIIF